MVPASIFRPVYLEDINAPAIVLPIQEYDQPFVVFGTGEGAIACFIGNQHRFHTMSATSNGNWQGLAIERLSIEVDLDSITTVQSAPIGSLVRTGDRLEMIVVSDSRGFRQRLVIDDKLPEGGSGIQAAFSRWHLILRDGSREIFKYEIVAGDLPLA